MFRSLSLSLVLLIPLFLSPALLAQEEEEKPTPSEVATEFAKEFKKEFKKLSETDVLEGIDKLVAYYKNESVDEKAKKTVLEAFEKAATSRSSVVVVKVVAKCGEMDDGVLKLLLKILSLELKKKVPEEDIYEGALESLGKLHSENPAAVKTLTDLLKNKDHAVVARAARAMGMYEGASGNVRKELFEEILKQTEGVYSSAQTGTDQNSERKWNIIGDDAMEAMHKLSKPPRSESEKLSNPPAARKWYNDNKKKRWDEKD